MLRVLSAARRPTNTWGDVQREWEFLCASMPELSLRPRSWKELHNRLTWLQIRDRRRHTKLLLGQAELLQQQTMLQLDSGPDEDISSDRDAANLHDGIAEGDFEDDGVDHGVPDEGALHSADGGGHSNADATVHMCSVCQESIDPGQELALPCACRKVSPCVGHFCCSCMQKYVATRLEGLLNTGIMPMFPCPCCQFLLPLPFVDTIVPFLRSVSVQPMPKRRELAELALMLTHGELDGRVSPFSDTRYPTLDSLTTPVLMACESYPAWDLLEQELRTSQMFSSLGVTAMTFKPYLDALRENTTTGKRVLALLCANALGWQRREDLFEEDWLQTASVQGALRDGVFVTTAPLWLEDGEPECWPLWLAEETMLKPEDTFNAIPTEATKSLFLSEEEAGALANEQLSDVDDSDLGAQRHRLIQLWREQPLWTRLLGAFHQHLLDARAQGDLERSLAAMFYASVVAANAANPRGSFAFGIEPRAACVALQGRLFNYHDAPQGWIRQLACTRLKLDTADRVATIDSVCLSLRHFNVQSLKAAVDKNGAALSARGFAMLCHKFADVNRIVMRHVRHKNTMMMVDSASDLKILLGLYTCGALLNHPTLADLVCYTCAKDYFKDNPHVLANFNIVVTGAGRTASSHTAMEAAQPSDTLNRLHSFAFVFLGWHGQVVLGGLIPPTTQGGSPQGKMPVVNSDKLEFHRHIQLAQSILQLADAGGKQLKELAKDRVELRSIYPDFISEQRLMASDLVSVTGTLFKYGRHGPGFGGASPDIFHVCGPQFEGTVPPLLPWPPDLAGQHAILRQGRYLTPPPVEIWPGPTKFPRKPTSRLQYFDLYRWWDKVQLSAETFALLTERSASQGASQGDVSTPLMKRKRGSSSGSNQRSSPRKAKMDGNAVQRCNPWTK